MRWWERLLGRKEPEEWLAEVKNQVLILTDSIQDYLLHPESEPIAETYLTPEKIKAQLETLSTARTLVESLAFGPLDEVKLSQLVAVLKPVVDLFSDLHRLIPESRHVKEWDTCARALRNALNHLTPSEGLKGQLVPKPA